MTGTGSAEDAVMQLQCTSCGTANATTAKFCAECGARLSAACASCGATLTPGQRFCGECGAAQSPVLEPRDQSSASPTPSAELARPPVVERRVCAVLFCDLVGFTPMSEGRDPERVREILSDYFALARTIVERHGGIVEKFIGDAVMAVWGTPVATEDDSERAVRTALDLVDGVASLGAGLGVGGLAARIGVVTGETAVTIGATGEGMVAGDTVNTAARVQTAAGSGSVFVDDATKRNAEASIGFEDAGPHALKGKSGEHRLWRVTRVLAGVRGAGRIDGLEASLIGRDFELRVIKDLFHATAARRQPRLVIVSGAAGSGKSRLGWEFEKYVDGLSSTVLWHRGRCLSYGEGVAFWALAEAVRQRLGIAENDSTDVAAEKLVAGLERYITDADERAYVGLRIGRLLGVAVGADTEGALQREDLFAGWRTFFVRLAEVEPVVLVIEDLHHADVGLLEFIDHVLDWARFSPIYLVAFARPELEERHPGWSLGRHRHQIVLEPLDESSMSQLLDALVPGMPSAALTAIAAHAYGVPLFAIETIRSLIDRDVVIARDGVYHLVGDVGELDVPDSLRALLATRLDHLDPRTRALVADAAVLGDTFPAEALASVTGRPLPDIRDDLQLLVRRELFTVSADPLSPQRGSYQFAHDMVRRVAYATLSIRDRKVRHLRVAEHLRRTFPNDGEEVADVIARHLLDAHDAVPDDQDADSIRRQAVTELVRAADRSRSVGAQSRAADSYAAAADRADGLTDRAALHEQAAVAYKIAANFTAVVAQADRARALLVEAGDLLGAARMDAAAGEAFGALNMPAAARDRFSAALDVLRPARVLETVMTLRMLAGVQIFAGEADGDALSAEALDLGEALGVPDDEMGRLLGGRGLFHAFAGHVPRAVAYEREAVRYAVKSNDARTAGSALMNLAVDLAVSDPHAAIEALESALVHFRSIGERAGLANAIANLTEIQIVVGLWDDAEATLRRAVDVDGVGDMPLVALSTVRLSALRGDVATGRAAAASFSDSQHPSPEWNATQAVVLAVLLDAEEQPGHALRQAESAIEGYREGVGIDSIALTWAWSLAARSAHRIHDVDAEIRLLDLVTDASRAVLSPILTAERDLVVARLAAGRSDPAASQLMDAAILAQRTGSTPYHLAHGLIDSSELSLSLSRADEARATGAEALEIAQRLRAAPLVRRAEEHLRTLDPVAAQL